MVALVTSSAVHWRIYLAVAQKEGAKERTDIFPLDRAFLIDGEMDRFRLQPYPTPEMARGPTS